MTHHYRTDIQGFATRRTSADALVVELDLEADPRKRDPLWQETMRRKIGETRWRREFKRDWTVATGKPFYPEFLVNPKTYTRVLPWMLDAPVYRSWDFGYRRPACLWSQYSPRTDRLWLIREMMPSNIDTYSFCALVQFLSGELDEEELKPYPKALTWLQWVRERAEQPKSKVPPPPWFGLGTRFMDFAGPEALKVSPTVAAEKAERTEAEVLASRGVILKLQSSSLESRETKVRKLLLQRPDGYPGLLIDPACELIMAGMGGGISYPDATKANPSPKKPKKDGYFEHLHDCLGYTVIQLTPAAQREDWGEGEELDDGVRVLDMAETRGIW